MLAYNALGIQPLRRGFYCDDDSIRYPYHDDTVSDGMATLICIFIPVICVSFTLPLCTLKPLYKLCLVPYVNVRECLGHTTLRSFYARESFRNYFYHARQNGTAYFVACQNGIISTSHVHVRKDRSGVCKSGSTSPVLVAIENVENNRPTYTKR